MTFLRRARDKNLDSTCAPQNSKCLEFIKTFMIPRMQTLSGDDFNVNDAEDLLLLRGCNELLLFSVRYTSRTSDDEWVKITKFRN